MSNPLPMFTVPSPATMQAFIQGKPIPGTAAPTLPTFTAPTIPQGEMTGVVKSDLPAPDRFVVLGGTPFSGKTEFALSFPDVVVLDFDHKITRRDIDTIEFWNDKFVDSLAPRVQQRHPANRRDALQNWIIDNGRHLANRTVVLDSLSKVETAFHQQTERVEEVKANVGGGVLFGKKLTYFSDIFAMLEAYCKRTVVTCHLAPIYGKDDKTGADMATGKMRPLITGQFAERIASFATANLHCFTEAAMTQTGYALKYFIGLRPSLAYDSRIAGLEGNYPDKLELQKGTGYQQFSKLWTA